MRRGLVWFWLFGLTTFMLAGSEAELAHTNNMNPTNKSNQNKQNSIVKHKTNLRKIKAINYFIYQKNTNLVPCVANLKELKLDFHKNIQLDKCCKEGEYPLVLNTGHYS